MSTTPTTPADDAVMCPVNPIGHEYRGTTRCAYCGRTRTARAAVVAMLAGGIRSGIGEEAAEALVSQMIAEEGQQ